MKEMLSSSSLPALRNSGQLALVVFQRSPELALIPLN